MLDHQFSLDRVFHTLADPTRRLIVERLMSGSAPIGKLAEPLEMSLAAVVQHINILEASGLIRTQKSGRVRTCHLEPGALQAAEAWFTQHRQLWERRFDRLETILAKAEKDRKNKEKEP